MLPDPRERPVLTVEEAASYLRLGRSAAYEAARRGELPVLRLGRRLRVPTALLARMLGHLDNDEGPAEAGPCAMSTTDPAARRSDDHVYGTRPLPG